MTNIDEYLATVSEYVYMFYHLIKGKENGKTIMRASISYTLYY